MLRPYQERAVQAMLSDFENKNKNSVVVMPTGSGKSWIIAEFAKRINQDVLIMTRSQELVKQDMEKLMMAGVSRDEIGVFAASLNEKTIKKYTFAIINSAKNHKSLFHHFKTVIVDECHDVSTENDETMYRELFRSMGHPKVYGLSATPYRNISYDRWEGGDLVKTTKLKIITRSGSFWDEIIYCLNNKDLTPEYLCPLDYKNNVLVKQSDIKMSGMDFNQDYYSPMISKHARDIHRIIDSLEQSHNSLIVFCPTIKFATGMSMVRDNSRLVTGETPKKERNQIINDFRNGAIKTVFNVGVLTTGFDHPPLDCIVCLRPTASVGLYQQMVGRGVRQYTGKTKCDIVDLTGNSMNFGGVDKINLKKIDGEWELLSPGHCWDGEIVSQIRVKSRYSQ